MIDLNKFPDDIIDLIQYHLQNKYKQDHILLNKEHYTYLRYNLNTYKYERFINNSIQDYNMSVMTLDVMYHNIRKYLQYLSYKNKLLLIETKNIYSVFLYNNENYFNISNVNKQKYENYISYLNENILEVEQENFVWTYLMIDILHKNYFMLIPIYINKKNYIVKL